MPTLAIGERGFTLVELMAVLAILSLATATVMLVIPSGRGSVVADAEKLAARIALVRDEAIISARPMAVVVDSDGYRFEEKRAGEWVQARGKGLSPKLWDNGQGLTSASIRVAFDATGTPDRDTVIPLAQKDVSANVTIESNGQVRVLR
jgi:general secretion pathway protein H